MSLKGLFPKAARKVWMLFVKWRRKSKNIVCIFIFTNISKGPCVLRKPNNP